jgi:hypothetical protein
LTAGLLPGHPRLEGGTAAGAEHPAGAGTCLEEKYYLLHIDCRVACLQYILHIQAIATGAFRMDQNLLCGTVGDCARRMRG